MYELNIVPGRLSLAQLRRAYAEPCRLNIDESAWAAVDESVACVNRIVDENRTVYGINTGFGLLASTRIAREDLEKLQHCGRYVLGVPILFFRFRIGFAVGRQPLCDDRS